MRTLPTVFSFFYVFFFTGLMGQTSKKEFQKKSYDELKILIFSESLNRFEKKKAAEVFLEKAKKDNDLNKLVRGYFFNSQNVDDFSTSIKYLDSIINEMKPNKKDPSFPVLAYYQKGLLYSKNYNYELAIENFLKVEKISIEIDNLEYYYDSKYAIGKLKSDNLGEVKDGLNLFKECFYYYKNQDVSKGYFSDAYQRTIFAIADSYKSLNKLDSASYYNNLGYQESKKTKNNRLHYLFILNEGANQVLKKDFIAAIDSVDIALPKLKEISNIGNNILASYYYYGKAYQGLMNDEKAVENFKLVDSIYQQTSVITPEFTDGYRFLINHYKKKGDKEKQLYYINTLMSIDSSFQKNYRILSRKIQKDYEIPNLIKEKEGIISSLKNDNRTNYWVIAFLGLGLGLSIFLIQRQKKQKKIYKQRFEALMQKQEIAESNFNELLFKDKIVNQKEENEESKDFEERKQEVIKEEEDLGIAKETVNMIISQLIVFEKEHQYLQPNLSLQSLAQQMETNTKYLSTIVNVKKGKSIINYINDLRVDFAIAQLKTNPSMRKYTINAIAEEVGFNTAESFSKAFFKRSGIKPSYFIKKIQEVS